jgi:hypothetical protein
MRAADTLVPGPQEPGQRHFPCSKIIRQNNIWLIREAVESLMPSSTHMVSSPHCDTEIEKFDTKLKF